MNRARLIFLACWAIVIASYAGQFLRHKPFGDGSWSDGH
jgi:hypothetical protein